MLNFVTIKPYLAKVTRDIRIMNTGLVNDIKAWISEAIELAQTTSQQVYLIQKGTLCDGQIELVFGVNTILTVFVDGKFVPFGRKVHGKMEYQEHHVRTFLPYEQAALPDIEMKIAGLLGSTFVQHARQAVEEKVARVHSEKGSFWYLNGNHLNTSSLKGNIEIHYEGIPVDEDGYPMAMNEPDLKEAIVQFVKSKLQGIGEIPGDENASFQRWEYHCRKAQITIEMPTYEESMERYDDSGL